MSKGHVSGRKFSHHTTLVPAAEPIAKFAGKDPRITRVVLGRIIPKTKGRHRIKITKIEAGLKIFVQSSSSGQILYLYTRESDAVTSDLERVFQKAFGA